MGETLIEMAGVDVHPGETLEPILHGVEWQVKRGECWAVGGAPGAGKTSLLATAASLNRPGAGALSLFGRDLADASEDEQVDWRRRIGYVFENGGRLLSHLTVAQNVALPLRYHIESMDGAQVSERIAILLEEAELSALAPVMPSRLSVRLQQRASLARALAVPTEILFLDNPLTGLSPREARWWTDYLRELQREDKALTIVATCDDYRPWLDVATHFAVIEAGKFRVLGGREQVLASTEASVRELL